MVSDELPRRIRERLDDPTELCRMLGLLERYKRQAGGGVLIRCPAHKDQTPSCSVTHGDGGTVRVRCFACDFTGDAITLIATAHGLDVRGDFKRVLEIGAGLAGIPIDGAVWSPEPAPERPRPVAKVEPAAVPDSIFDAVATELQRAGALDSEVWCAQNVARYLDGRGILEWAKADGWFAMGAHSAQALSQFAPEILHRCGLTDADGRMHWPAHALAIPWRNARGEVQTIQRRHLGDCDAGRRYVFPTGRGPASPYGIDRLGSGKGPIAIVEGAVDVLAKRTLDELGWTTVLGAAGVSGWRAAWDELVVDRIVVIAFDADEAGEREALKLGDRFHEAGAFGVRRATPTRGKDWAEAMRVSA